MDYKTILIFKNVSLPSPKIALLNISYYLNGASGNSNDNGNMKFRRITVRENSSSTDVSENITPRLTDEQELQNTAKEVEKQEQDRIAAAQAERDKKDNEAALKRMQSTTAKKKPKTQ